MLCCIQALFLVQRLCSSSRNTKRSLLVKLWELKDKQLEAQSPCRDWQDTTDSLWWKLCDGPGVRVHCKRVIFFFFFMLLYLSVFNVHNYSITTGQTGKMSRSLKIIQTSLEFVLSGRASYQATVCITEWTFHIFLLGVNIVFKHPPLTQKPHLLFVELVVGWSRRGCSVLHLYPELIWLGIPEESGLLVWSQWCLLFMANVDCLCPLINVTPKTKFKFGHSLNSKQTSFQKKHWISVAKSLLLLSPSWLTATLLDTVGFLYNPPPPPPLLIS